MNRINNKTLLLIIAVLLLSNIFLLVFYRLPPKENQDKGPVDYMARELNLDERQRAGFDELWTANRARNKPYYDSLRLIKDSLFGLLPVQPAPDSQIHAMTLRINQYDNRILLNNFDHFKKLRAICDAEQQVKLDTVIRKMGRRRR